jgi:hypothetical protein
MFRGRIKELDPILLGGELIERQVGADGWKYLGIFFQAVLLEFRLGEGCVGSLPRSTSVARRDHPTTEVAPCERGLKGDQ